MGLHIRHRRHDNAKSFYASAAAAAVLAHREPGWVKFDSANLKEAKYDSTKQVLFIKFHDSDRIYRFTGITQKVWDGLQNADSHGSYFHRYIAPKLRRQ